MTNQKITTFTDLITWQEAHQLVILIYTATNLYPKEERYSLVDQMRRAAVSITSNIAEGFGRKSYKEISRFYLIARGSLTELINQLILSKDLKYLPINKYEQCSQLALKTQRLLNGLISKTDTLA